MCLPSLTCDKHDDWQGITIQNAAKALLLFQAPVYENNDITNESFPSPPSSDDKDGLHEAQITGALKEKKLLKCTCRKRTLRKHCL